MQLVRFVQSWFQGMIVLLLSKVDSLLESFCITSVMTVTDQCTAVKCGLQASAPELWLPDNSCFCSAKIKLAVD